MVAKSSVKTEGDAATTTNTTPTKAEEAITKTEEEVPGKEHDRGKKGLNYTDLHRAHIYGCLISAWDDLNLETGKFNGKVCNLTRVKLDARFKSVRKPSNRAIRGIHERLEKNKTLTKHAKGGRKQSANRDKIVSAFLLHEPVSARALTKMLKEEGCEVSHNLVNRTLRDHKLISSCSPRPKKTESAAAQAAVAAAAAATAAAVAAQGKVK